MDIKMTQTNNPLNHYFRQPAIYVQLPSDGQFWPPGSLTMPENHELPVLPMTAIDEITYRTPDALFNGQAVVSVIQSCCPSIKNAWHCPVVDVDTILTAIRIASYGHELELSTVCPNCQHEDEYNIDLRTILQGLRMPNYNQTVSQGDLEIYFAPISYQQLHTTTSAQFQDQKTIQNLNDANVPEEEKIEILKGAMAQITDLTVRMLGMSISTIKTPNVMVTEKAHIEDFLRNCDRKVFQEIRDHIIELRKDSDFKPLSIKCSSCEHDYQQSFTLNQSNFFGNAS
jgi:hypothetical protein